MSSPYTGLADRRLTDRRQDIAAMGATAEQFRHRAKLAEEHASMLASQLADCRAQVLPLQAQRDELLAALQPFVARNSSETHITITVRTADIANARAAIAKATGGAA